MNFYGISSSEGALDKNIGCEKAPEFLAKVFGADVNEFHLTKNDLEKQQEEIFVQGKEVFEKNKKETNVFFGGTHNITYSLFWAFLKNNPKAKLIIFDAHVDSDEGLSLVSHEDFIKQLIHNGFSAEKIMIIGVTKIFESEKEFVETSGIKILKANEISDNKEFAKKEISNFVSSGQVYFSFDVDVLKEMKSTYYPDGELSKETTKELVNIVIPFSKAIDLVELDPEKVNGEEKFLEELFFSIFKNSN